MEITQMHMEGINRWIRNYFRGLEQDPDHYLNGCEDNWLLYGTDTAQRPYLAVLDLVCQLEYENSLRKAPIEKHARGITKGDESRISNSKIVFNYDTLLIQATGDGTRPFSLAGGNFPTDQSRDFFNRFNTSPFSLSGLPFEKLRIGSLKHDNSQNPVDPDDVLGTLRFYAVRRACKFLLYDAISQGFKIRYVLDDLNLTAVAGKAAVAGNGEKVPVCTTELREIFRSWDFFRNHVTFYLDFQKVAPPWSYANPWCDVNTMYLWAWYANHLATKQINKNGTVPEVSYENSILFSCQTLFDQHNWVPAIAHYHASKPSRHRHAAMLHL